LLAQAVATGFEGKVRFVAENYGDSELARRFGVTRYPALFVDDILVATPNDFGFYGKDEQGEGGRYAPLRSAAAHERLRADLQRMLELVLSGKSDEARAVAAPAPEKALAKFPDVEDIELEDLDGEPIPADELDGRLVLVEFWATWCPPCRKTLPWLGELEQRFGDDLTILAIAVESPEATVRKVVEKLELPVSFVLGEPALVRAFGDVGAVPTLLLFDREGRGAASWFGAPPTLHEDVEAKLEALRR
jgi:thiol-disulfide isomerase/thioredoxin